MRCFYHGDVEAVAVCKSCGHGICHDCCAEVGTDAACRNRCEGDVAALNQIIERSRAVCAKKGAANRQSGWVLLIAGLILGGAAIYVSPGGTPNPMLLAFAGFFIAVGVVQFVIARRQNAK